MANSYTLSKEAMNVLKASAEQSVVDGDLNAADREYLDGLLGSLTGVLAHLAPSASTSKFKFAVIPADAKTSRELVDECIRSSESAAASLQASQAQTPGRDPAARTPQPQGGQGRPGSSGSSGKRPADPQGGEPPAKRRKPAGKLLGFHLRELLALVEGIPEVKEAVELLEEAVDLALKGAGPELPTYHLGRVKQLLPGNQEVTRAARLLELSIVHGKMCTGVKNRIGAEPCDACSSVWVPMWNRVQGLFNMAVSRDSQDGDHWGSVELYSTMQHILSFWIRDGTPNMFWFRFGTPNMFAPEGQRMSAHSQVVIGTQHILSGRIRFGMPDAFAPKVQCLSAHSRVVVCTSIVSHNNQRYVDCLYDPYVWCLWIRIGTGILRSRGVESGAATMGVTGGSQCDIAAEPMLLCPPGPTSDSPRKSNFNSSPRLDMLEILRFFIFKPFRFGTTNSSCAQKVVTKWCRGIFVRGKSRAGDIWANATTSRSFGRRDLEVIRHVRSRFPAASPPTITFNRDLPLNPAPSPTIKLSFVPGLYTSDSTARQRAQWQCAVACEADVRYIDWYCQEKPDEAVVVVGYHISPDVKTFWGKVRHYTVDFVKVTGGHRKPVGSGHIYYSRKDRRWRAIAYGNVRTKALHLILARRSTWAKYPLSRIGLIFLYARYLVEYRVAMSVWDASVNRSQTQRAALDSIRARDGQRILLGGLRFGSANIFDPGADASTFCNAVEGTVTASRSVRGVPADPARNGTAAMGGVDTGDMVTFGT
ncbi:hypothetical protein BV22DRAFT_1052137 [Leucogyrophana mollusca]|uniref:Uncharacterized protein n=1 Tax=Leucogyrophana mollusca TaxID=85980 RepID=A0ACB8AWE5_9AGAM|nr:hypothetical protein BV22DRAFT_1052137 [Leucogyrophana mollusca]